MAKKKGLGIAKPALQITGGAVILGVGSSVATGVGGSAVGLTTMASFMPAMGAAVGGGIVLEQTRKLQPKKRRRR